jgi:Mg-chelatase subunit ChlD
MHMPAPLRTTLAVLATLVTVACTDSTSPATASRAPATVQVTGVSIAPDQFRATGTFAVGVLPLTADGTPALEGVGVDGQLASVGSAETAAGFTLRKGEVRKKGPTGRAAIDAAILLDNSGSMSSNDPTRLRAVAAQLFWERLFAARASNRAALLDFGFAPTSGFRDTRLLQGWTSVAAELASRLPSVQPGPAGTPLYGSMSETLRWMQATAAPAAGRVMLLLSDGQPTDPVGRVAALEAIRSSGTTVHAVGLGPASDASRSPDPAAVRAMQEVASVGGGVYAAATDAAALGAVFDVLARVSASGQLVAEFAVTPVPRPGTRVRGVIYVPRPPRAPAVATWSFVAP